MADEKDEIYVVTQFNVTEKRRDLTNEEKEELFGKGRKALEKVGGKHVLRLVCIAKEGAVVVVSFPNIEAWLTYKKTLEFSGNEGEALDIARYFTAEHTICKKSEVWESIKTIV